MITYNEEIEQAYKCHKSINENLKNTPIILRRAETEILHKSECTNFKEIVQSEIKNEFAHQWVNGGDHFLLKEILEAGFVPDAWREYWNPDSPPTLKHALCSAKDKGYLVPDEFLLSDKTSYSEKEAFLAAYMFINGTKDFYRNEVWENTEFFLWKENLTQFTGQFIVPDPIVSSKTPYIIDQLWIVHVPPDRVRLIGLEIDGETHLDPKAIERDKKRDVMLAAMGYEIYHVSGWWCRIDPYRVIAEFLKASNISSLPLQYLIGANFQSIWDYQCQICGKPMVRWDVDWIQEIEHDGDLLITHKSCAENMTENTNDECYD